MLTTEIAVTTAVGLCHATIATAFLGAANFCQQFKQCCNNGRSIRCTVTMPCNDVVVLPPHLSHLPIGHFFPSREYTVRGRMRRNDYSVNVRYVSHHNEQYIPLFRNVGFEFKDISKTFAIDTDLKGLTYYNKMITRLASFADEHFFQIFGSRGIDVAYLKKQEKEILMEICEDFAESNNKKIVSKIENAAFIKVDGDGTKIHFDEGPAIDLTTKDGARIKVWIPLSDIDNYPLAVGDARSYFKFHGVCKSTNHSIGRCATKRDFRDAVWYQQEQMTPTDAVFWNKHAVPHCSLNLGNDRNTKERIALVFEFVTQEIA